MLIIVSLLLSMFIGSVNAQERVSPYGAKVISLADGGRTIVKGYDAVMTNPASAYFIDDSEFGYGMNFGYSFASLSLLYAGDSGFQAGFGAKDIDRSFKVDSLQTYMGYSFELSKWWIIGANLGYNFSSTHNGWDANFGISFGPGLPTANRSGLVGAITIRNPFEHAGVGEIAATIGYSYRSSFNVCIDNIYSFRDLLHPLAGGGYPDAYDIVFAIETFPLEEDDFSMTFSGRINSVGDYNDLQIGMGFGYVMTMTSRINIGAFATEFKHAKIKAMTFGFSFIQGV